MADELSGLDFSDLDADPPEESTPESPPENAADSQSPTEAEETPKKPAVVQGAFAFDDEKPKESSEPEKPAKPEKKRKALAEIAPIIAGVFAVVGLIAWVSVTFVFAESEEEETTLELPRNRMEAVMAELSVGKIRHVGAIEKQEGDQQQSVFIVEIDAAIIVYGTASELVDVEQTLKSHHHRIEEAIDETIRSAADHHLSEPDVLIIRTRVRDRINEFLGRRLVREVLFSHYRAFRTPIKS